MGLTDLSQGVGWAESRPEAWTHLTVASARLGCDMTWYPLHDPKQVGFVYTRSVDLLDLQDLTAVVRLAGKDQHS